MNLRLLFLGRLQDLAGAGEQMVRAEAATVAKLIAGLDPLLAAELASERVRIAVNGAVVGRDAVLRDGDEVAFLPPVSGG